MAAALVAAVLWRFPGTGDSPQVQINGEAPIEIVELAAEGEDFKLMIEDPEFYSWVADQAGNGGTASAEAAPHPADASFEALGGTGGRDRDGRGTRRRCCG